MRLLSSFLVGLSVLLAAGPGAACADDALYQALGEKSGIERITDGLLEKLHTDPRTKEFFVDADEKRLRTKLIEQLCQLSGGPCEYTGRSMKRSHEGLQITRAAFNALVEDLQDAMDENHIPFHTQNKLLALLAPMVHDIEER
ncbi:MAG: group 1 truncated hemoglobin [Burkholderiaceae bacterium]